MEISPDDMTAVLNRLKRAQGQLGGVIRLIEEGNDCKTIITQLSAASKAIDRAGFAILSSGLQQCLDDKGRMDPDDAETLEKLFLTLA